MVIGKCTPIVFVLTHFWVKMNLDFYRKSLKGKLLKKLVQQNQSILTCRKYSFQTSETHTNYKYQRSPSVYRSVHF